MGTEGILLVNKPAGVTSFSLVGALRRKLGIQKIGHAGTLDPFATGLMVMLIGRSYTSKSDQFLESDKEYLAEIHLGITTDTYDCHGKTIETSGIVPTLYEIEKAIQNFQGTIDQIPPMFSAKKVNGKKLYELARKGKEIERKPVQVNLQTNILEYQYPFLRVRISCSKGTYIRSIAFDIGNLLGSGAHVSKLERVRSGQFHLDNAVDGSKLNSPDIDLTPFLIK